MGYIIKDTAALLNTKLTDAARKKMSEGSFNISYFQIGDSEVCYDCITGEDLTTGMVIDSEYNAQNLAPVPEKNKSNIKYPIKVTSTSTNTFGIPINSSYVDNIYNTAAPRGFFNTGSSGNYNSVLVSSAYTVNPNFVFDISTINSGDTLSLSASVLDVNVTGNVSEGDLVTLYNGQSGSISNINNLMPILFYKVLSVTGDTSGNTGTVTIKLDRQLPDFSTMGYTGNGRAIFYPSGMTELYDSYTPQYYWQSDAIDFESNCDISDTDVKIWGMNIPWTESPAGVFSTTHLGYDNYTSRKYVGTKEYLGYNSTGQTDTSSTYYYNSFSEKINLSPSDQKSIAIVHYTNQAIDNFYGEKFALQPYSSSSPGDTGQARNFKITLPWLMWHKSTDSNIGETFYVDPPGYNGLGLFEEHYIKSVPNSNMNNPGMRYYHLWDTNTNTNGYPNRVGKVWPDIKMVTFDDDEIIASLSYKSNRNWTLPSPKLGLIVPNTCNGTSADDEGLLSGSSQSLWVTYRLNSSAFTESLHCNYYSLIKGTDPDCPPDTADVTVRFGDEFPFLFSEIGSSPSGFSANDFTILAQKVTTGQKPDPTKWKEIDITSQLESTKVNGYLTVSGLTNTTILINKPDYDSAGLYDLSDYINIPSVGQSGTALNFGDEYFFYGEVQTDIQATIYVMNYLCNLGQGQFMTSNNPTWPDSQSPYVSEIGLYDSDKNLMIISKVQSPELRLGVQQYSIKIDF
jgi:hypothetical protein